LFEDESISDGGDKAEDHGAYIVNDEVDTFINEFAEDWVEVEK